MGALVDCSCLGKGRRNVEWLVVQDSGTGNKNPSENIKTPDLPKIMGYPYQMDMVQKEERMRKKKKHNNIIAEKENKNDAPLRRGMKMLQEVPRIVIMFPDV